MLKKGLESFPKVQNIAWVQEEPANGGAWSYIRPLLQQIAGSEPVYVGRPPMAATAVGSHRAHAQEQKKLISKAFSL